MQLHFITFIYKTCPIFNSCKRLYCLMRFFFNLPNNSYLLLKFKFNYIYGTLHATAFIVIYYQVLMFYKKILTLIYLIIDFIK